MATGLPVISGAGAQTLGSPDGTRIWREEVYEGLTDISPSDSATINLLATEDVDDVVFRWPLKRLNPLPTGNPGYPEGVEFSALTATWQKRPMLTNNAEKFVKAVNVSDDSRKVQMFGDNDEFYLKSAEAVEEMRREMEQRILDDTFAVVANTNFIGDATTTTILMKPLMQLIFQARDYLVSPTAPAQGDSVNAFRSSDMARVDRPAGTLTTESAVLDTGGTYPLWAQTKWTETMCTKLQELMRGNKDRGGVNIDTILAPPANWGQTGAFGTGPGTGTGYGDLNVNIDASLRKIIRSVHFFKSNFGMVQVLEARFLDQAKNTGAVTTMVAGATPRGATRNCGLIWGFERKFVQTCWFQRPEIKKMGITGLNEKAIVNAQMGLRLLHPHAAGVIIGVNNV